MTPPDLTPEQMNERLVSDFCALIENRCGTVRGIGPAVREGLPKLFAAWQEQTAAKAGENPVPDEAGAHAQQAWDEGAMYPDRSSE